MLSSWRGMTGQVREQCGDGLHLLIDAEGRCWRVPIAETKFGR
jgi:hypothetical protein